MKGAGDVGLATLSEEQRRAKTTERLAASKPELAGTDGRGATRKRNCRCCGRGIYFIVGGLWGCERCDRMDLWPRVRRTGDGRQPWSLLLVKITSALDAIVGVAGLTVVVLGADVPDGALIAVGTFLAATVTGILGWALVTLGTCVPAGGPHVRTGR